MLQLVHTKRGRWSPAGILDSTGEPQLLQKFKIYTLKKSGARRGNRTHTVSPPPDFESGASTSSAIRACQAAKYIRLLGRSAHLVVFVRHAAHRLPVRSSAGADRAAARDAAFREPVACPRRGAGHIRGSGVSRPTEAVARRR